MMTVSYMFINEDDNEFPMYVEFDPIGDRVASSIK